MISNIIIVAYYSRWMYNDRHIIFYKGMYVFIVLVLVYYNILVILEKIESFEWNFVILVRKTTIHLVLHVLTIRLSRFVEVMYIYIIIVLYNRRRVNYWRTRMKLDSSHEKDENSYCLPRIDCNTMKKHRCWSVFLYSYEVLM